jgi:uncharacterized membrane protein
MVKELYIESLSLELDKLGVGSEEKSEILEDFGQHFIDGEQEGLTERQICEKLGDTREIAKQYSSNALTEYTPPVYEPAESGKINIGGLIGIIWADILIFSWAVPVFTVLAIVFYVVVLSLVLSGLVTVVASVFVPSIVFTTFPMLSVFFIGVAYMSLGGLLSLLSVKVFRLFINGIKLWLNLHGQWVKGKNIFEINKTNEKQAEVTLS